MKNIYVNTCEGYMLEKVFKKDIVSLDEILNKFEDLVCDNDALQEKLDDLKQDLHDNYKPIKPEEQY
jgi:hypothetical protein